MKRRKIPVLFDTLAYSIGLKKKGIKHSETYAILLADALSENLYSKHKVDNMFNEALKRHDRRMDKIEMKIEKNIHEARLETARIANRIIVILGSLIVIIGAISTFSHVLFHV